MNHEIVFETERTYASHWQTASANEAFEIYGDPEVTKWTYGVPDVDVEATRKKLQYLIERNAKFKKGMGSFPVYCKRTDLLVGNALIKPLPDAEGNFTDDIEIGWHLRRSVWGSGFATEFGRKLIEIGFQDLKLPRLHAVVDLRNQPSANVALRLGMKDHGTTTKYYNGDPIMHFVLDCEDWPNGK